MYNGVHICRTLLASGRRYFSFREGLPSVRSRGRKGLGLPGFYCPNASSQIPRIVYISRALRAISCMLGPGGLVKVDGPLANARCTQCGFALRLRSHHLARSCAVSALAGRPGPRRRPCAALPPVWPSNGIQLRAAPPAWRSECLRRKCRVPMAFTSATWTDSRGSGPVALAGARGHAWSWGRTYPLPGCSSECLWALPPLHAYVCAGIS